MAPSWTFDTDESIDYRDFLEHFKAQGKDLFNGDLDASALVMRRLANNRLFLTERLNEQLKNLKTFQTSNLYTPQVFILDVDEMFFIRANIWEPRKQRPGESLFFYETPHDHNFSFLTVGYHGSGYRTAIHEYDNAGVIGYPREPVKLRSLEETALPFGKVMFFRSSIDVHTQLPPAELSISINVLRRPGRDQIDQYLFDTKRSELVRKLDKLPNGVVVRMAAALGSESTIDVLSHVMKSHVCRRTRLLAYQGVAQRRGGQVWEQALDDEDELVRTVAAQSLARIVNAA